MANIQIRVQLQDTIEDTINGVSSANEINNTSIQKSGNDFKEISTSNDGINMKSWAKGYLSLADGYVGGANTKLVDQYGYDGYVFGAVPSNNQLKVTIAISGEYIDSVIFYGDKNARQFPTKAYLDGDTNNIIYSDDPIWAVKFENVSSSHTITFLEWNRAEYNACLTSIVVLRNELFLDNRYVKDLESTSQTTSANSEINFNAIPNKGSIEILDRNGELLDYLNDGILENSKFPLSIYANNKLVQNHICESADYDLESRVLSIDVTNELSDFYSGKYNTNYDSQTLRLNWTPLQILQVLGFDTKTLLQNKYIVRNGKNISLYNYLSQITIPYVVYNSNKREILEKICQICQLNFSVNDNGEYEFYDARPLEYVSISSDDPYYDEIMSGGIAPNELIDYKTIVIPYGKQFSILNVEPIVRNKYERVHCNQTVVEYSIDKVVEERFSISDDGTTIKDISNFPSSAQIIECSNGDKKLCFLKEFSVQGNEVIDLNVSFSKDGIRPVYIQKVGNPINDNFLGYFPEYNKDNFQFDNISRSLVRLLSPVTSNYKLLAIEIVIYSASSSTLAEEVSYYIYGKKYIFNQEDVYYGSGTTTVQLQQNDFLQKGTTFTESNGTQHKLLDLIAESIISDYKDGIMTGKITIACDDYFSALYYNTEKKIKKVNWSKGEIIKIGDIVRIDKDNNGNSESVYSNGNARLWKVTGRTFKDSGVPLIDLELQEIINNK